MKDISVSIKRAHILGKYLQACIQWTFSLLAEAVEAVPPCIQVEVVEVAARLFVKPSMLDHLKIFRSLLGKEVRLGMCMQLTKLIMGMQEKTLLLKIL